MVKTILCPLFDLTFHFIIFCHRACCTVMAGRHGVVIRHKVALERINGQSSKQSSRCGQGYDAMKAICLVFLRFRPLWNNCRTALLCPRPLTCHLNSDCETSQKLLKPQPRRTKVTHAVDDDAMMQMCSRCLNSD